MKGIALLSLFGAAIAHPAGLWWGTDVCYTSPDNTENQCSDLQETGFDFSEPNGFDLSELGNGDNWSLEGFHFSGLTPKNSCQSGGNCLGGTLSRDDDWTIKISAADAPFSIRNFHLATSRNTDVFIIYEMPDGSSCRHVTSSSYKGTDVGNDQCGGAVSVEFTLPEESKFGDCDIEIHRIDFDCSTGTKPPVHSSHSEPAPTPSSTGTKPPAHSSHSEPAPTPSSTVSSSVHWPSSTFEVPTNSHSSHKMTTSTVWTTHETTVTKCAPTVTDCPAHSTVLVTSTYPLSTTLCPYTPVHSDPPTVSLPSLHQTSSPTLGVPTTTHPSHQLTTSTIWTTEEVTITKCPPTVTNCPAHSTVLSTSTYPLSTTVCPYTPVETKTSTSHRAVHSDPSITHSISATAPTAPSPPAVTVPCPNVVPKCLNTWLTIPKCDSNSDAACFCPSGEFTGKVSGCIRAWSSSKEEEDSALAYFAGICAPFVPQNPAIVDIATTCTSSYTPVTTADPRITGTTHTIVKTVGVATSIPQAPCTTISWASHTATVPLVGFSTVTCSSTTSVNLVVVTTPNPPAKTSHPAHLSSTLTTSCKSTSTSFVTPTSPKTTVTKPTPPKPTETVTYDNFGSKLPLCSFWAFGVAVLAFFL
ncbi:unnamed protein product [Penicillium glandicola]